MAECLMRDDGGRVPAVSKPAFKSIHQRVEFCREAERSVLVFDRSIRVLANQHLLDEPNSCRRQLLRV
jgi:hypothetical protein